MRRYTFEIDPEATTDQTIGIHVVCRCGWEEDVLISKRHVVTKDGCFHGLAVAQYPDALLDHEARCAADLDDFFRLRIAVAKSSQMAWETVAQRFGHHYDVATEAAHQVTIWKAKAAKAESAARIAVLGAHMVRGEVVEL